MEKGNKAMKDVLLETNKISKHFASTVAVNEVSLVVRPGEIRGLIGENGSGKSTLSSVVAGILQPNGGNMHFNGVSFAPKTALEAQAAGVGMIVQEAGTVSGISIAENIFLGRDAEFSKLFFVNRRAMVAKANEALRKIGVENIDAGEPIESLDMQDRKLVEVAKVMWDDPQLLIVDESTTALSHTGRDLLYDLMRKMKEEGRSVLFISHDLEELMDICDTLTVLRDGDKIADLEKEEFEAGRIKQLMVGREMKGDYYPIYVREAVADEPVLEAKNVYTYEGLSNVNLVLHKGEILGIGGLSHSGMHQLGRLLFGIEKPLLGQVDYAPTGERLKDPYHAMQLGFGYVSKNRDTESLVLAASVKDNIAICGLDIFDVGPGIIWGPKETEYVQELVDCLQIKCSSIDQHTQYLSGGNKQKVVFAKWKGRQADVLVLDCPTRGVDIGVKAAMYQLMNEMRLAGKAIVMISEELPELIGMCDRILMMKDGKITGEVAERSQMSEAVLIDYMI